MWPKLAIALGAGIAGALLCIVTIRGTPMALALANFAPLPLMIATIGWGFDVGLVALAASCALVAGAVEPLSGAIYGAMVALPAWAIAGFAGLKSAPGFSFATLGRKNNTAATPSELPKPAAPASLGAIALMAGVFGALVGVGMLITMIVVYGGYDKAVASLGEILRSMAEDDGNVTLPNDVTLDSAVKVVAQFAPVAVAASTTLMYLFNLYLAARSAQLSQRLPRPWVDVPTGLSLPVVLAAPTLLAFAASFLAPAPISQFGLIIAAAAAVLYLAQGLAVLHALSRRAPARPGLLVALYAACAIAPHWVLPIVALIGLIESFASLRARAAAQQSYRPRT